MGQFPLHLCSNTVQICVSRSRSLHILLLSVSIFWLIVGKKILFVLKACCSKIQKCFVLYVFGFFWSCFDDYYLCLAGGKREGAELRAIHLCNKYLRNVC